MRANLKVSSLTQRLLSGNASITAATAPTIGATPDNLAGETALPTKPRKRHKLWEMDEKHHCPIIGTCIPLPELVKFARRFEFAASLHDEFSLHVEAVCNARQRNVFSEAMQRHLDRKYQQQIVQFNSLKTDAEVRRQWQACLTQGHVAGALWATYTHKAASDATRQRVHADIHMLSHQIGAGQAADTRRLEQLEKENGELKYTLQAEEEKSKLQAADRQRQKLLVEQQNAELERLRRKLAEAQQRLSAFASGRVLVDMGERIASLQETNAQLTQTAQQAWKFEKLLRLSHQECQRIAEERDQALEERASMAQLLQVLDSPEAPCQEAGPDCLHCEQALSSRCILYVGGRVSMIAQYRQLAERLGVRLVHHDGGLEESLARLPELIRNADAVVCPTDNVGHSAYYQVKQQCKRVGKPCLFYEGSGVSSFALALGKVARGEFSMAGTGVEQTGGALIGTDA